MERNIKDKILSGNIKKRKQHMSTALLDKIIKSIHGRMGNLVFNNRQRVPPAVR